MGAMRMAQRKRHGWSGEMRRRLERLGARPMVVACVVVLAVVGSLGVGLAWQSSGGFEVVRGSGQAAFDPGGDDGTGAATEASDEPSAASPTASQQEASVQTVVVHVDGAVASPGVYELAGEAPRVGDAVDAAGGLAANADTSGINLAARVADGTKVHVPVVGEPSEATSGTSSAVDASLANGQAGTMPSGLVNINTATSEELQTLSGVGEATAEAIIHDREQNGPFASIEDLMRVSGIGEKKFAKLQGSICV